MADAPSTFRGSDVAVAVTEITAAITVTRPIFAFTGGAYTTATKVLVKAGAFAGYTYTKFDLIYIKSGTGVTPGYYRIASRDSDDQVTLQDGLVGSNISDVVAAHGRVPFNVTVSAHTTTGTGSNNPFDELEYHWDFGDSSSFEITNTNSKTGEAETIDLNDEQYGPVASYIYRQPGTYTITLTVRGWDGDEYISDTAQTQITVEAMSALTPRQYFDSVAGNDSNNGNDPWGFNFTGAAWTASTRTLTKADEFTDYVHDANTYDLAEQSTNWIYISGGTGVTVGWYEIESKTSNSALVLKTSIKGTDAADVASNSTGPKAGFAAINTWTSGAVRRRAYLKVGSTFNNAASSFIDLEHDTGVIGYGTGARPLATRGSGTTAVLNQGNGRHVEIKGIEVVELTASNTNPLIRLFASTNGTADPLIWKCKATGECSPAIQTTATFGSGGVVSRPFVWQNEISGQATLSAYFKVDSYDWLSIYANSKSGGHVAAGDLTHHFYPAIYGTHGGVIKFNICGLATGLISFCFNINTPEPGVDDVVCNHLVIAENDLYGTRNGIDISNNNNDVTDGRISDVIIENNRFHSGQLTQSVDDDFAVSPITVERMVFRRNGMFGDNCRITAYATTDGLQPVVYQNDVYAARRFINLDDDGVASGSVLRNNRVHFIGDTPSATEHIAAYEASSSTLWAVSGNTFYAPSAASPIWDGSAAESVAAFDTEFSSTTLTTNPSFADPANGDFRPAAPSGFTATAVGSDTINLTWTDNTATETGFRIEVSADGISGWTEVTTTAANAESYAHEGLDPETQYFYRIYAESAVGDSEPDTADATTGAEGGPANKMGLGLGFGLGI